MRWFALVIAATVGACVGPPKPPPVQGGATFDETRQGPSSTLWVSYQIVLESIDGRPVEITSEAGDGLYYRVDVDAGERTLKVRLDYNAGTHTVRTGSVELDVVLTADESYRLLDIGAPSPVNRAFDPRLVPGEPSD